MVARLGGAILIVGTLAVVAAAGLTAVGMEAPFVVASIVVFALGAVAVAIVGPRPFGRGARVGLFLVAVGSVGVARVLGGATSDGWAALGYFLIGGALVALGSLVTGIGLARSMGVAQRVGFVLLGGAIPWIIGAFVGAGDNLPFFVFGGAILAIGYAGVGLLALGLGAPRPVADPTS